MSVKLSRIATEESTYVVTATFTDEDGAAVVPKEITWTLTDSEGTVINSRKAVSITPAASVDIVLSGADLDVTETRNGVREILISALYDSALGADLPLNAAAVFIVENLAGLP